MKIRQMILICSFVIVSFGDKASDIRDYNELVDNIAVSSLNLI